MSSTNAWLLSCAWKKKKGMAIAMVLQAECAPDFAGQSVLYLLLRIWKPRGPTTIICVWNSPHSLADDQLRIVARGSL